ncbi:MAG: hypothetical protein ACOX5G_07170 [Kiritimatiellia bacterium]|jgi:cell division protein FtsZ
MNFEDNSLLLAGVGGAGCRIAAAARRSFGAGLRAVGFDSDALEARAIEDLRCAVLGASRLDGRGTGGDRVNGRLAVQDDAERVREALSGARTAVVVCGLGGGFSNGGTPEVLRIAREAGVATLCFATLPFAFEGAERRAEANRAAAILEEHADALCLLPLDDLFESAPGGAGLPLPEAIRRATDILSSALVLFWRLLFTPGFVRFDADDLLTILRQGGGRFRFAVSQADNSPDRARNAVKALVQSPLLGGAKALGNAQALVLGILGGEDLRLRELSTVTDAVTAACQPGCPLRMGTVLDDRFDGSIQLVALAFEKWGAAGTGDDAAFSLSGHGKASGAPMAARRAGRSNLFQIDPAILNGENLDEPTFLRRGITLPR